MRCLQCNVVLNDEESCHKLGNGQYADTCFSCLYDDYSCDESEWFGDNPEDPLLYDQPAD